MYNFLKGLAFICLIIHTILLFIAVTDWFNRIFIGVSLLVILLPKKMWGIYVLPSIITLAGTLAGGYLLFLYCFY